MRRVVVGIWVAAVCLFAAPAALATVQRATAGDITAAFSFTGTFPNYHHQQLTISQGGTVVYNQPVVSKVCGSLCAPGAPEPGYSSVHILDVEHNGRPDVILDLFSGGAHCCAIEQIFTLNPATSTYAETEHNFGDPGARIVDLGHDGSYEFLTADDAFAYEFTSYAGSGLPIQILTFSAGRFTDVTSAHRSLVVHDAAVWLKAYRGLARQHYAASTGVIAAWAADEDRLGHSGLVNRYLRAQARLGHLNSGMGPLEPSGRRFIAALQRFLHRHGYLH
ncbi:MAG: hypothetical protein WBQ18_12145 [Solirubrobacteraceae bacterium]